MTRRWVPTGDGWELALKRTRAHVPPGGSPARHALIIPGYGMNSFIFGFHPSGLSLEGYLASRGVDVFSVDLRAQGESRDRGGSRKYGLAELAILDVGAAIRGAREWSGAREVDVIGCSLGASLALGHLACVPDAPVRAVVSMGGLVTWVDPHPLVRAVFFSPRLVGLATGLWTGLGPALVPRGGHTGGTRAFAERVLPLLARHAPRLLTIYLNAESTDLSHAATMVKTVEDPSPTMNREIARWIAQRELVIRDVNVSRALARMTNPFMAVIANQDGIVPPRTARALFEQIGSTRKELLCVGDARTPIAHADLFVADGVQETVFAKVADFLLAA
jgi:alpha-beta hydrolase superfamily lysophospholipase